MLYARRAYNASTASQKSFHNPSTILRPLRRRVVRRASAQRPSSELQRPHCNPTTSPRSSYNAFGLTSPYCTLVDRTTPPPISYNPPATLPQSSHPYVGALYATQVHNAPSSDPQRSHHDPTTSPPSSYNDPSRASPRCMLAERTTLPPISDNPATILPPSSHVGALYAALVHNGPSSSLQCPHHSPTTRPAPRRCVVRS